MISLTRLNGQRFAVNPDLIQRAEATPDTIVTLVDGTKLLVKEGIDEVVSIVDDHRAAMVARAIEIANAEADLPPTPPRHRSRAHLSVQPEVD
ncbi:flagellar FlbD family protein [Demequina mangrovi]|uniref:Flagellar protein FlbD n=1 Tax=Demequina mangrovi TaxID=1043493 RepID=A0A1H7A2L1_9MICO|nr:flagellar FlbD family protein [Demequina mangrovi]SEJ56100.1 flagellar protein FlbD [Demequina mangrovi]